MCRMPIFVHMHFHKPDVPVSHTVNLIHRTTLTPFESFLSQHSLTIQTVKCLKPKQFGDFISGFSAAACGLQLLGLPEDGS